jgi:hypothetical protein
MNTRRIERAQGSSQVVFVEVNNKVQVSCCAQISMQHDRNTTRNQIPHVLLVERLEYSFDTSDHGLILAGAEKGGAGTYLVACSRLVAREWTTAGRIRSR